MAGRPRTTLRRVQGLLENANALLHAFNAVMPAMYRSRPAVHRPRSAMYRTRSGVAGDDPISQGWNSSRESIGNVVADLSVLGKLLEGKVAAATGIVPPGPVENRADAADPANEAETASAPNEYRGDGDSRRPDDSVATRSRHPQVRDSSPDRVLPADELGHVPISSTLMPAAPSPDDETVQILAEILWTYDYIRREDFSPEDAPCPEAGVFLEIVRKDATLLHEPWRIFADTPSEAGKIEADWRSRVAAAGLADA